MTAGQISADQIAMAPASARSERRQYLFGPITDFVCLGGSSLIYVPLLFLRPADQYRVPLGVAMLLLANAVNHPHFAHSYQIFYRNFRQKISGADYAPGLRRRYLLAGVVAPIVLALFFLACVLSGDGRVLAFAGNIMAFVVGWHYVKQGYGMLMVDAALKKRFFNASEKKLLLVNSYAVWLFSWLAINVAVSEREMWGLSYYSFDVPTPVLALSAAAAVAVGCATLWMFVARWRDGRKLPVNGVVAYVASLYAWLLLVRIDPLWFLVVPVLHSLQYLIVVWRFEANFQRGQGGGAAADARRLLDRLFGSPDRARLAAFVALGWVLGFLGFWAVPFLLDAVVPYDQAAFGSTMFVFIFWIFINVHHYLLDNVMWRRENPDTQRYLFG